MAILRDDQPILHDLRNAIPEWMNKWTFTRFATLQFNDFRNRRLPVGNRLFHVRKALRAWDAFINRAILGRYWAKADNADRIFAFYFPEKTTNSPHWHGMIRFYTDDPVQLARQEAIFDAKAERLWRKIAPSGTCSILPIHDQRGVANYLAKTLPYPVSYKHFVIPDEFARG